jgi:hypothetical protein
VDRAAAKAILSGAGTCTMQSGCRSSTRSRGFDMTFDRFLATLVTAVAIDLGDRYDLQRERLPWVHISLVAAVVTCRCANAHC